MIIIITTNSIDLKQQINLKNTKKIKSIGELDLTISNSISLKDEVINFCKKENIDWDCDVSTKWDPIGKLEDTKESPEILKDKFSKCCLNSSGVIPNVVRVI